jgi:hypothetical protein
MGGRERASRSESGVSVCCGGNQGSHGCITGEK